MSGSQYIALSGMRARLDELDQLASDIANIGTTGFKGLRGSRNPAERAVFEDTLQTAIDTTNGANRLDMTNGALAPTGNMLDVAIDGKGFFVVDTPAGPRYTRDGHFMIGADRKLMTSDGFAVQGAAGPIIMGEGDTRVAEDGTVWAGTTQAGKLSIVTFGDPGQLVREQSALLRADDQTATAVDAPILHAGTLEQSNVTVADRLAQLTSVSRGFEALQKAISLLMNDVDGKAIDHLGRR